MTSDAGRGADAGGETHDGAEGCGGDRAPLPPPAGAVLGPAPVWAVAAIAGGLLGESAGAPFGRTVAGWLGGVGSLGAVGSVVAGVVLVGRWVGRSGRSRGSRAAARTPGGSLWRGLLAVLAVVAVTAVGSAVRIATTELGLLPQLSGQGGEVDVLGTVVHEPRPIATGWHVVLRVETVAGTATRERAALTLDDDPPPLGSRWRARVSARPLPDGGYGTWLARQHVSVLLDASTWEAAGDPGPLARSSEHVRARVRQAATRHLDDRTGGLLVGFVTGDTRLLPADDQAAMQATGLTHLTAVSGSNVAIVLGGVLGLLGLLRVGTRGRWLAVALVVPWFAFVTRFEPSVQRAGTMALVLLAASVRGVPRDARHGLAVAVLLLLLVDPRLAGSLGLVLSATATAGVLVAAPRVRAHLPQRLPSRLADLASITIGAQIAVVPVVLATFGEVTFASIPANLVAVPAAAVAAAIAFVGSTLALVVPPLGGVVLALAGPPAGIVLAVAHTFAGVGGRADLARPATLAALLVGCVWLLLAPRTWAARVALVTCVALVAVAGVPQVRGRLPPTGFTVTAIDVGQGDAYLVESPGARVLIDAGEDETAARWLREHGRTSLDLLVVTHGHRDHVGGAPEVLRRLDVGVVWYRPLPTELPEAAELLTQAAARGIPVRDVAAGDRVVLGDLAIDVLGPPPGRPYRYARSELNESSTILRVASAGRRALFPGDAEREAQADLMATGEDPTVELLAVPHHGGATSDPAFLQASGALVAMISVGRDNRHGHPHPDVLEVLAAMGAEVRRTDLEGTVRVEVPARPASGTDQRWEQEPAAAAVGRVSGTAPARPVASLASRHASLPAPRRRRRAAAATRARAAARPAPVRRPGTRRRRPRRVGDRAPPGAADRVAVRGTHLRRAPWGGGDGRRPEGRGRGVRRVPFRRRRPRAGGTGGGPDPEGRAVGQASRRAHRGEDPAGLGGPRLGPAGR
jgi:competence protein ComEC